MSYLIDTDIIIYSLKNNPVVHRNFALHEEAPKAISIITYGELLIGARKSAHIEKNLGITYRIKELFPIISIDLPVIETFSSIKTTLQRNGTTIDDMDLFIAATALSMNLTLVTNNEKHFSKVDGLILENWSRE